MKTTTLRAIVTQVVSAIDMSSTTRLTEIVFEGEAVYMRTNHAGVSPPCSGSAENHDPVSQWLRQHDPDAG